MSDDFLELDEPGTDTGSSDKPQLILGRFASQADLEKAYRELEAAHTQKSQELAETKRQAEALQVPQQVQPAVEEDEDDDQLFFTNPAKAVEKAVKKVIDPLLTANYVQQKEAFRSNPEFLKYEQEIDALISSQPALKTQPGIVGQVFKMVRGLHFDEGEFERQVREKIKTEQSDKKLGSLDSASASDLASRTGQEPDLTPDEKRVAIKFNPGVAKEEAFRKYAEKKAKYGGR